MAEYLIPAIVSAAVALVVGGLSFWQATRSLRLQSRQIREAVTVEHIKARLPVYEPFMQALECASSRHQTNGELEESRVNNARDLLQNAIYGNVGLVASFETRELILYTRSQCARYLNGKVSYEDFKLAFWSLHISLRSDLGISQPGWQDAVRKMDLDPKFSGFASLSRQIREYWRPGEGGRAWDA